MLTGAWLFEMQGDDTGLANALYVALSRMSFYFWVMELQRKLLLPGGLVRAHFRWPEQRSVAVSRCVLRLEQTFLPAGFLMLLCYSLYPRDVGASLGALAVVALLLSLTRFFYRLPPFVQERMESIFAHERSERSTLLGRMTRLFLTWVPVLGIVAVVLGYSFTALELALLLVRTILLFTALLLVHELGLRWLRLTRRKMILKVRQELSQAGGQVGEANPDEEILENDPDLLSDEGTKFINALVIIGGAVGVFLIWSAVLPAFGIFEGVELWHRQGIVDGREAIIPVTLADVFFALFVLFLGWVAMRRIPSLLEIFLRQRVHVSAASAYAATRVFQYGVTTLLVVYVMGILGGSWGNIQWAVAALSVGIGFGLQEIVANFISGLIILFEQPIRVGDTVTVGEVSGTVTKIRIRATTIRDWDRRELLVPNKEFVTSRLLNWTLSDAVTRVHLKVGVAYGTDMVEALRVVRLAAEEHPLVLKDPEPIITFDDFGDNSLLITLRFYLDGLDQRLVTTSELRMAINDRFNELGIVVAFPQRDVHLDASEPIPVRMVDGTPARD
jgi:potassium efflux system protein